MPAAKEKLLDVNMRQKINYAAFSYRDCFVAPLLAMTMAYGCHCERSEAISMRMRRYTRVWPPATAKEKAEASTGSCRGRRSGGAGEADDQTG